MCISYIAFSTWSENIDLDVNATQSRKKKCIWREERCAHDCYKSALSNAVVIRSRADGRKTMADEENQFLAIWTKFKACRRKKRKSAVCPVRQKIAIESNEKSTEERSGTGNERKMTNNDAHRHELNCTQTKMQRSIASSASALSMPQIAHWPTAMYALGWCARLCVCVCNCAHSHLLRPIIVTRHIWIIQ